ncbi:very short patch repair endonuclease [Caproicibacterium sp. XB2]|jgi:DNA mismatch endonuclease (patch repair protein)|uniref:very short patch repair endonuclease n=1 Tax=Caproicibacterium sp. XB2 TaxID=3388458 RepID=UPI00384C50B5
MDDLTPEQRRKNMQHIRSKDTGIEVKLRKALWHKGYRYRKNYKELPGKPDIVLMKYKIAIFCDSEFFHGKDWPELEKRILRGSNSEYWYGKITRNMERDSEVNRTLYGKGWTVLRFWGKDIEKHLDECIKVVNEAVFDQMLLIDA